MTRAEVVATLARSGRKPLAPEADRYAHPCGDCGAATSAVVVSLHGGAGETPDRAVPRYRCAACVDERFAQTLQRVGVGRR